MMDGLIVEFDKALRTVFAPARSIRPRPGALVPEVNLEDEDRRLSAALMRVNHCGEICAQALYQGQAIMSKDITSRLALESAAQEETEHLAWTEQRIAELGGRKSWLNPFWYGGSLAIGLVAGACGDRWNLGFLAETERQVEAHLSSHLGRLPADDQRSRAIVQQMQADEASHAKTAESLGAHQIPAPIQSAMRFASRIMTTLSHRV